MRKIFNVVRSNVDSLMFRLLKYLGAIVLTIVIILGTMLFCGLQSRMQREQQQILHASLCHIDTIFSQYLDRAKSIAVEIFNSLEGKKCRLETTVLMDNVGLLRDMNSSVSNNSFIHSIYILDKNDQVALHVSGYKHFTDEISVVLAEQLSQQSSRNKPFFWMVESRFKGEGSIPLLSVYMRETVNSSKYYTGAVVVNIDLLWIARELFAETGELMEKFILDDQGRVILHSGGNYYGQDFSGKEEIREFMEGEYLDNFLRSRNAFCEISMLQSDWDNFYIFAQSNYLEYMDGIREGLLITILAILIVTFGILVFAYLANKNIFKPLTKVVEEIKSADVLQDAQKYNGNELDYLNRYHQSMTEYIKELKQEEEKDHVVKNLLLGNSVQSQLLHKGVLCREEPYYLILIYMLEDEDGVGGNLLRYDAHNKAICRELAEQLGNIGRCTGYVASMRRLLFLLAEEPDKEWDQKEILHRVQQCILRYFTEMENQQFVLLTERAENGEQECVILYKNVNSRLKTRLLLNPEPADYSGEPRSRETETVLEKQVWKAIESGNKAAYKKAVNQLLDCMQDTVWESFIEFMEQLIRDLMSKSVSQKKMTEEKLWQCIKEKVGTLGSRQELLQWFEVIYDETVYGIHEANASDVTKIIERAIDYINNYYADQELNMNILARKLNISGSYFGKSFKDYTGCSMAEYLTKVRMEKARNLLLLEEKKDITQIAQEVGYSSSAYFTTVFKKYFGVSPSKLRSYYVLQKDS